MAAHADIAWSRQLAVTSPRQLAMWTVAALVIFVAHAGAAWLVTRQAPEPPMQEMVAGSIEVDLAALGFTSADQVSAGAVAETVEPVTAQPVEPAETAPAVETTPPVAEAKPVEQARPVEPVEPTQPTAAEAVPVEPVQPQLPQVPSEAVIASLPPETEVPEEPRPVEPQAVVPAETLEPVEEDPVAQEMAALVHVPLPEPRPDYTPTAVVKPEKPKEKPRETAERKPAEKPEKKETRKAPPKKSGSGGQNQADARKGVAEGSAKGKAAAESKAGRSSREGNAAVSNYPGKVASKLRRSLRYPSQARRERLRGEVHVSFTVSSSGGVGGVRIARSSGSPVLDKAAVDTVRRAAPFPPIPQGAGRSSWPFTVPLAFTR